MRGLRNILICLLLSLSFFYGRAQSQDILPTGVAPASAGVAYTRQWVPWENPSSLISSDRVKMTLAYENRYFTRELSDACVAVSVPTPYLHVAAAYNFFGYDEYHEMMAAVTVARKFGPVAVGVEFDYFNMRLSHLDGYRHTFTAQVGMQAWITPDLVLGARIFNPIFSKVRYENEVRKIPVLMQVGVSYTFISDLDVLAQISYTLNGGVDWAVGMEYRIFDALLVRAGARGADYVVPSLGVGLRYRRFSFDLTAEADFAVGMSLMSNLGVTF